MDCVIVLKYTLFSISIYADKEINLSVSDVRVYDNNDIFLSLQIIGIFAFRLLLLLNHVNLICQKLSK